MVKRKLLIGALAFYSAIGACADTQSIALSVEELRIDKAKSAITTINDYYDWSKLQAQWLKHSNITAARQALITLGDNLWQHSKRQSQQALLMDDRPLYWTRLAIISYLKTHPSIFNHNQLTSLIESFEKSSRGHNDLDFVERTDKRIIITGFDPFLLDRNISQSNPSGLAALMLDGLVIKYKGVTAEINTVMIPVRYEDFDDGEIEALLAPYYALNSVDMIATISMGRSNFDLEHFPSLRRSSAVPDNSNIYTGANRHSPLVPKLQSSQLSDIEFVEFSLPYQAMMKAKGPYKINDNRVVTTLKRKSEKRNHKFTVTSLSDLANKVSVNGSGGGYLSNEISYRSILLRNRLGSDIPTGHIHTPSIRKFNADKNQQVIDQIKAMLTLALTEI